MIKVTVMYNNNVTKTYECKQTEHYSNYTLLILESGNIIYLPYYNILNILEEKNLWVKGGLKWVFILVV